MGEISPRHPFTLPKYECSVSKTGCCPRSTWCYLSHVLESRVRTAKERGKTCSQTDLDQNPHAAATGNKNCFFSEHLSPQLEKQTPLCFPTGWLWGGYREQMAHSHSVPPMHPELSKHWWICSQTSTPLSSVTPYAVWRTRNRAGFPKVPQKRHKTSRNKKGICKVGECTWVFERKKETESHGSGKICNTSPTLSYNYYCQMRFD